MRWPHSCCCQERELQLLTGTLTDLRAETEKHKQRVRELEEQIQSDDRAERLEITLQNTQNRADELEFQLSKLKQVCASSGSIGILNSSSWLTSHTDASCAR